VQREKLILALPQALAVEGNPRIDLREIASLTAIIPARHTSSGLYEQVMTAYQMAGVVPERVHYTRLLQTSLLLVGAGIGVSVMPESFRAIHVEGVVYRGFQVEPPLCELTAAWRRDNESPLLKRFVQELRRIAAPKTE
jgi:DNA-binding transcriptional LysR family regulator